MCVNCSFILYHVHPLTHPAGHYRVPWWDERPTVPRSPQISCQESKGEVTIVILISVELPIALHKNCTQSNVTSCQLAHEHATRNWWRLHKLAVAQCHPLRNAYNLLTVNKEWKWRGPTNPTIVSIKMIFVKRLIVPISVQWAALNVECND